jgi:pimeloyl-ACP methyl ester carboxylesterase
MNLHYHRLGNGPHTLLAFHGIGQDGKDCFSSFAENMGDYYTVYAFDLFFHGESNHRDITKTFDEHPVSKEQWSGIISHFLEKENISRFDVAGFSMGGRFALATLEFYSNRIDNAWLIAPDGVSEHPLYLIASRFPPTRRLFRWCMQHPKTFFQTASVLQKMGLVHKSLFRFTQNVLNTPEKRQSVYNSWTGFRKLHFNIQQICLLSQRDKVRIYLFTGKYDKLLKEADMKPLINSIPAKQYYRLQSGHSQLVEKTSHIVREILS